MRKLNRTFLSHSALRAAIAACMAVWLLALAEPPATAQEQGPLFEELVPPIEVGTHSPLNLADLTWRLGAGDGRELASPAYDDEQWVAGSAVNPELLRNRVAWYRFHFTIAPEARGMGSELLLGGVEGNAAVYLNGHLIGRMRGAVYPLYRRREAFGLAPSLLRYDADNVLAIRLSGFTGQPLVGIPAGPLAMAAFSPALPWPGPVAAAASGSVSFGRFGGGDLTGLLTCELGPDGFAAATTSLAPAPLFGTFGSPAPGDRVKIQSLSSVGKIALVRQARGERYRVFYPLLYPGFALEPLAATLSVHLAGDLDLLYVDRWGVTTHSARVNAAIPWVEPWLCLYDPRSRRAPLLVSLPSPAWTIQLKKTRSGFDLLLPAGATARFCWPWGIAPHVPTAHAADMARIRHWAAAMVPFALHPDDEIEPDGLHAHDRFGYLAAGAIPYAPLPPVIGLALGHGAGLPVGSARTLVSPWPAGLLGAERPPASPAAHDLGLPTLAGPLWAATGSDEVAYDLPVPSLDRPQVQSASASVALPKLPGALARSAADLAFSGRVWAYLHWDRLSTPERRYLQANSAYQIKRAWSQASWARSSEPETGTRFVWTAARLEGAGAAASPSRSGRYEPTGSESPGALALSNRLGAFGLGNGLALYGTSVAALYGQDWSLVRPAWPAMQRAFDWFPDAFDWAWQSACNSQRGLSTGAGQTLAAGYLGALGMARMARVVAPDEQDRYLAFAARMAVLVGERPALSRWAIRQGLLRKGQVAFGLSQHGVEAASGSAALFGSLGNLPDIRAVPPGARASRRAPR